MRWGEKLVRETRAWMGHQDGGQNMLENGGSTNSSFGGTKTNIGGKEILRDDVPHARSVLFRLGRAEEPRALTDVGRAKSELG